MSYKIFYAWQSKTPSKYNWSFIEECLKDAIKQLKKQLRDDSPDFYIDRDTKGVPGIPNIVWTIEEKIKFCDVFVADLTFINITLNQAPIQQQTILQKIFNILPKTPQFSIDSIMEGIPAPNVTQELGLALGSTTTSERIVTIINTAYGDPTKLHFDISQRKFPIRYEYNEKTTVEQKKVEKKTLTEALKARLSEIFITEHERQKLHFSPFITWKNWKTLIDRTFQFEQTDYISELFNVLQGNINIEKIIYRICGLSGIGKTRMLFECFNDEDGISTSEISNKVLYVDSNEIEEKDISKAIKELLHRKENKILIIDNCSKDLHNSITSLATGPFSKLSIITISTDPDERPSQLDSTRITNLLILDNQKCKETVTKILVNNFSEFEEQEQKLLIEFSSGLSFIATLMALNPERGKYQPGTLTREDVIKRLLGPIYTDDISRAAVLATSLFSRFGFFDDLSYQRDKIALCKDLFIVDEGTINKEDVNEWRIMKFIEVCTLLSERQLLEKKGRTFSFRPSPLAIRMAEDWWRNCNVKKFERILPVLKEADLVESFCEQFKYLNHVENAKTIVENLCDDFFSSAEVLDTTVGSRLFRSFVYVNPMASTKALQKAFLNLSIDNLIKMTEGRRNLVWALEKLCFRPDTFEGAIKVLAAFAVAENETFGNNATNQLLQLFHIYLPGTTVSLNDRWNIIDYFLDEGGQYIDLALKSLNSCLKSDNFHRTSGAEEQGDTISLTEFSPTQIEIKDYWLKAINQLKSYSFNNSEFSEFAVKILFENFYSLCAHGAGELIIPVIENIIESRLVSKTEARKRIQFIIKSNKVFDEFSIKLLQQIYERLEPSSFEERFRLFVQAPSSDEYFSEDKNNDEPENYRKNISKKIDGLAKEFIMQKNDWKSLSNLFVSDTIYEGTNFGVSISENLESNSHRSEILYFLVDALKKVTFEKRNISVIAGILMGSKDKHLQTEFFNYILDDNELNVYSFSFARVIELPISEIDKLLKETEKGRFHVQQFFNFEYGWGLRHLSYENIISILNRLRLMNNIGKAVAFFIISRWTHGNDKIWPTYKNQIRSQLIEDSEAILENSKGTMDYFEWSQSLSKILEEEIDLELARTAVRLILDEMNEFEEYYNKESSFLRIMDVLQKKYFEILWDELTNVYLNLEKYGLTAMHLKDLLGSRQDAYINTEGILFKDDPHKFELVIKWCKENEGYEIHWIVQLLPIFNTYEQDQWHPYAKAFIDEFGNNNDVLSGIDSKIGTYSWIGSIVERLEQNKKLYESLLLHKNINVRKWAEVNVKSLIKRIEWEKNRDEEGY
jgi:hypothetical protein